MPDYPTQPRECCPKEIYFKEIKLWTVAYLRYKKKPKDNKIEGKFERDIKAYKSYITKYINEHNQANKRTFRVAFTRETLDFSGDPYVRLAIYLEYAERARLEGSQKFDVSSETGLPARTGEVKSEIKDTETPPDGNAPGLKADESGKPENENRAFAANAVMGGPGPVTPPRCPPDNPNLSVTEVSATECGFQQ
ncbi:MAG: hypothetical protein EOO04_12160 [Chitinophagaceae bacterium]|nr:MAG: hypothetical protein EOO04_12160 [Chitinophagaceae bacterium]